MPSSSVRGGALGRDGAVRCGGARGRDRGGGREAGASRAGGARRATRGVWGAQPGQAIGRISSSAAWDRFQCDGCCGGALSSDGALAAPAASRRDELAAGGRGCVFAAGGAESGVCCGRYGAGSSGGEGFSRIGYASGRGRGRGRQSVLWTRRV